MHRAITEAQFQNAIPRYVDRARKLTDQIIENGLIKPDSIQLTVWHIGRFGVIPELDKIQELWQQRDEQTRMQFRANVPLEGLQLSLERTYKTSCAAWIHRSTSEKERFDPANLISPVWSFQETGEEDNPYRIQCGLYKETISSTLLGRKDIVEIAEASYRQARYPRLGPSDEERLKQGVYTLNTFKIEHILRIMDLVVR